MASTLQSGPFRLLLRQHRLAAGLSQSELAERAGLSRRGISDLERGARSSPRPSTLRRLTNALDLNERERASLLASLGFSIRHDTRLGPSPTPSGTTPSSLHYLPRSPTPLIGRERELQEASHRLLQERTRLLTLTGPGGSGKTRLALELVTRLHQRFEHGAYVVDLSPIVDSALVVREIGRVLGLHERPNVSLLEALQGELRDKRVLLMLDNFEQVLPAAVALWSLLESCPELFVLVTSRESLRLSWEQVMPVPPLGVPDLSSASVRQNIADSPSVALFLQRARAVQPEFAPTKDELRTIAEMCELLDGLPLAIELAAAQCDIASPSELLGGLRSSRRLDLVNRSQDAPARHRSLRAAIGWTCDRLSAAEQTLLRRLSVFAGGCTLEAVQAICGPFEASSASDVIAALVRKSLLKRERGCDGGSRFRMLETIREYAHESLVQIGETRRCQLHHAQYFLAFAERAAWESTNGPERHVWQGRLEQDMDNLRAAMRCAIEQSDPELGLRLGSALGPYWYVRDHLGEGRGWLAELLAPGGASAPTPWRAGALLVLGFEHRKIGNAATERAAFEEALALARRVGRAGTVKRALNSGPWPPTAATVARALNMLGSMAIDEGDYGRACELLREGITASRASHDRMGEAFCLANLSLATMALSDFPKARALMEQSLAVWHEVGDAWGTAIALCGLGDIARAQQDYATASAYFERSRVINKEIGDRQKEARALLRLGSVTLDRGDVAAARPLLVGALRTFFEMGDRADIAGALESLGRVTVLGGGAPDRALRLAASAACLRDAVQTYPMPAERACLERWLDHARNRMGPDAADVAWAEGRSMSLDDAVRLALATDSQSSASSVQRPLTRREQEVAACLARGLANRRIAERLVITERTVAAHIEHIMRKLDLTSRTQVALWAAAHGVHNSDWT